MSALIPLHRPANEPSLDRMLQEAAERVMARNRYVLGEEVDGFEREFAAFCGSTHCVGVANGTDAIELALRAVGVARDDRVVTVANAGGYATAAIEAIGAQPVYADVDGDLGMSVDDLQRVSQGARAIVVTHLYGRMAAVERIVEFASTTGVPVVEDCAQAHGARVGGRHAGTFGAVGCFSFYPTKNLGALGDGGAVVTSDDAIASRLRALRQYGWTEKYRVDLVGGRNSRLDEMQAAFLRVKLPHLDRWNAQRVAVARRYHDALRDLPLRSPRWSGAEYVAHLFVIRSAGRDALRAFLAAHNIATEIHYPTADHLQPVCTDDRRSPLPATEAACREVLSLPCFPGMVPQEVERVIDAVRGHHAGAAT